MKVIYFVLLLAVVGYCSTEVQKTEAELDIEYQVIFAPSSLQYYVDFIKGLFSSDANGPPLYKQCDGRWANDVISTKTVCQVGCLMSSISMALAGKGQTIEGALANPGSFNRWLKANGGYQGNSYVWSTVHWFGLNFKGYFSDVTSYANQPRTVVVLNVNNGGHWVLATGYANGAFSVLDPGYNRSSYSRGEVVDAGVYTY
jgi:hypothetical protein